MQVYTLLQLVVSNDVKKNSSRMTAYSTKGDSPPNDAFYLTLKLTAAV